MWHDNNILSMYSFYMFILIVFDRILLSGMNDKNQDLEEMDHRLLTYISIFHTMYVIILIHINVYFL